MGFLTWLLLVSAIFVFLAYNRMSLKVWTLAAGIIVALMTIGGEQPVPTPLLLLIWTGFAAAAICLNVTSIRRRLISDKALALFRGVLPSMSRTEKEALEAGTVWWDGDLFSGKPDWNRLLTTPTPRLTDREQEFIDGPVEELCEMLDDWKITNELNDLPQEMWQFIKDNGFFGMIIPKAYGGLEFSALAHSSVVTKIASRSITAAVTVMVPNSLGPAELLMHYGTDKQKNHYLPRLAKGEDIPCFALTGPEAGSDASAMPDKGVICKREFEGEKDVLGILLNWEKRYITLGPVATLVGLAFKLYDPDHLVGDSDEMGITCALVPSDTPGVCIGNRHAPLNLAFMNGPNSGEDVFIPIDWVIGAKEGLGKGWSMLMESLAAGRSISLPALSTGAGKLVCRYTGAYSRIRKQFRTPIGKFEGIEAPLARMAGVTYMMDAVRIMTAGAVDMGEKPAVLSAIAKYNLTENMRMAINDAMDIQGGSAICMGPQNYLARPYQAIPISITVEGANILTRTLITYGQGAIRCHPYVLQEMQAAQSKDKEQASVTFDKAIFGHIGFTISNFVRAFVLGLTRGRIVSPPVSGPTSRYYQHLTRLSAAFAMTSDVCMLILGGALKRKEHLSGRLADILSHLYLASATLKHYEDQGRPADDQLLVDWVCRRSIHTIQTSMEAIFRNFPLPIVGRILRVIVFPTGKHYRPPSDKLDHQVASLLLEPSSTRDRLTRGIYITANPNDPVGRIEYALPKVIAADSIDRKIRKAIKDGKLKEGPQEAMLRDAKILGLIDNDELDVLRDAIVARRNAIMVDEFDAVQKNDNNKEDAQWPKAQ